MPDGPDGAPGDRGRFAHQETDNVCKARREAMCEKESKCQKPDELKGKPEQCSPEQIKKCHGDAKKHPCTDTTRDE
jgi:hypothetical protein